MVIQASPVSSATFMIETIEIFFLDMNQISQIPINWTRLILNELS